MIFFFSFSVFVLNNMLMPITIGYTYCISRGVEMKSDHNYIIYN